MCQLKIIDIVTCVGGTGEAGLATGGGASLGNGGNGRLGSGSLVLGGGGGGFTNGGNASLTVSGSGGTGAVIISYQIGKGFVDNVPST